jgi:pyridine nucleotide-disulfide oxidoreductase
MSLTPLQSRLRPSDLLGVFQVPGYPNVYHLPTGEAPQRVISQQRRALNLVFALRQRLRDTDAGATTRDIAVIGGGFGGITAAAYAAAFGFTVTLFEREPELLYRFRRSRRWLFPHLQDWPAPSWVYPDANLPILRWKRKEARRVRRDLLKEFKWLSDVLGGRLESRTSTTAKPHPGKLSLADCAATVSSWPSELEKGLVKVKQEPFRSVIVATGFADERAPVGTGPADWLPYWEARDVEGTRNRPLLVMGVRDGGLAALIQAAGVRDPELEVTLKLVTQQIDKKTLAGLRRFERRIAELRTLFPAADLSLQITKHYRAVASDVHLVSETTLPDPTYFIGSGRHSALLCDGTYPANRILTAALLRNHEERGRKWRYLKGVAELGRPLAKPDPAWNAARSATVTFKRTRTALPRMVLTCDVVVRTGPGEPPIADILEQQTTEELRRRDVILNLELTERPLYPSPVRPSNGPPTDLPPLPAKQRLRVYSEFYDSYIQRNLITTLGPGLASKVLLGRLRFQSLLFDQVLLTDAMILDGQAFSIIATQAPGALEALLPQLQVVAREETLEHALLKLLHASDSERPHPESIPELSLAAGTELRAALRKDLSEVFSKPKKWQPIKTLTDLRDALRRSKHKAHWSELLEKWHRLITAFQGAPRSLWKESIASPIPPIVRSQDPRLDRELVRTIAAEFANSRTRVFAALGKSADTLLADKGLAPTVQWYNSAYNEAIAIAQDATVFDSFWLPAALIGEKEDRAREQDHDVNASPRLNYRLVGDCTAEDWNAITLPLMRARALSWRQGHGGNRRRKPAVQERAAQQQRETGYATAATLSEITRSVGAALGADAKATEIGPSKVRGGGTFQAQIAAYRGPVNLRERVFSLDAGLPGARRVRCIIESARGHSTALAATRLFKGG